MGRRAARMRRFEDGLRSQLLELSTKVNVDQPVEGVDIKDGVLTGVYNTYNMGGRYYRFTVHITTRGERNILHRVLNEKSTGYGISGGEDWLGRGEVTGYLYIR